MQYETLEDFVASLHTNIQPYAIALLHAAGVPVDAKMDDVQEVMTSDVDWDKYDDPDLFGENYEDEPEEIEMMMEEVAGTETELINTISAWDHLYKESLIKRDRDGDNYEDEDEDGDNYEDEEDEDWDNHEDEDGDGDENVEDDEEDYTEEEINRTLYYLSF
jgi:hypothetical protein